MERSTIEKVNALSKCFIIGIIVVLGVVLFTSGCSEVVDRGDWTHANKLCEDKEGVFSITARSDPFVNTVTCKNGYRAHVGGTVTDRVERENK